MIANYSSSVCTPAGYLTALAAYESAKVSLDAAEKELTDSFKFKAEGATSFEVDGYKLTITGRINRKIDGKLWEMIKAQIPEVLHPVRYKPEIDLKGVRYLQENNEKMYAIFSECLTATPGKPSVSVTKKGE